MTYATVMVSLALDQPNDEDREVTAQLDGIAADIDAAVIVAGAYGHSRFRELILGGMTQHLITQSARCVLLSHQS
jgi:nucleotide-binding universal stress UspA family protein